MERTESHFSVDSGGPAPRVPRAGLSTRPQRRERDPYQQALNDCAKTPREGEKLQVPRLRMESSLNGGQAAHLAVFERKMLASPGHRVSRVTPDPDAQRHHVARR